MKKLLGFALALIFVVTLIPVASMAEAEHDHISTEWFDGGCQSSPGHPGKHYWSRHCRICGIILEELTPTCSGNGWHLTPAPIYPYA